jgi:O-acetyl-ADP-ribose deacetylase (regulator of RNase III)
MITTINKDILTVDKGVIVHSVNCIGAVGGLAGAIGRKWPVNAGEYRSHVRSQNYPVMLLGSVFEVNVAHNVIVANLFGQYNIGTSKQQTEYAALIRGFASIADRIFLGNDMETVSFGVLGVEDVPITLKDIYIPYKIGCGLGGADWETVQDILHQIFENNHKNVYICKHE